MKKITFNLIFWLLIIWQCGCKKLVDVDPPQTSLTAQSVFSSNSTAIGAVTQLYSNAAGSVVNNVSFLGLSSVPGSSSDELLYFGTNPSLSAFSKNSLTASTATGSQFWNNFYQVYIYNCNRIIESLQIQKTSDEDRDSKLSAGVKRQLIGEAKFLRSFIYFYLIQMYGDVPLLTTSDYIINSTAVRSAKHLVYNQIINDLKQAESTLSDGYVESDVITSTPSSPRIRPNKWAAKALLARVYLYTKDFPNAELESKAVIAHSGLYSLASLSEIFLANSSEAIWQLQPVVLGRNTQEAWTFTLPAAGPDLTNRPYYINPTLISAFENGDKRKVSWINSRTVRGVTYYYPSKYKNATINLPVTEYSMVLRLAEQYLICAEACIMQGKTSDAQLMINVIRNRAGLGNTTATTEETMMAAILAERRIELFTEFGHRWFDLKRLSKVDEVMNLVTPLKASQAWQPHQAYYPIAQSQIDLNRNITQTPGY